MDLLYGTILGGLIAGITALGVQKLSNDHAAKLASDGREHDEKVRRRVAGAASAKTVLAHLDAIRAVFDENTGQWGGPSQQQYKAAYEAVPLASLDIDDPVVAKTLTDIAYAYWHAWLAIESGEWTQWSVNRTLFNLALDTARRYTQGGQHANHSELDRIMKDIEFGIETREENERQSREAWLQEQKKEREAAAKAKAMPVKRRVTKRNATGGASAS